MIKTQVYLTENQMMTLKEVAQKQGRHYAELFRIALDDYLKKMQVTRKKRVDWAQVARDYAEPMGGISQKIDQELYR